MIFLIGIWVVILILFNFDISTADRRWSLVRVRVKRLNWISSHQKQNCFQAKKNWRNLEVNLLTHEKHKLKVLFSQWFVYSAQIINWMNMFFFSQPHSDRMTLRPSKTIVCTGDKREGRLIALFSQFISFLFSYFSQIINFLS